MISISGSALNSIDRSSALYKKILDAHHRLAKKDVTIWGRDAEAEAAIRLGWVDLPEKSRELLPQLDAISAKHRGKNRVILCGMGGSSLGPEVIAATFGKKLFVLDSTDPNYIAHALEGELAKTVVVVSSKSGSTIETAAQRALFENAFTLAGLKAEEHIVIVTDPNSPLDKEARARGYGVVNGDPSVGGRFSVLSAFGLLPAALIGIDVSVLLDNALDAKQNLQANPNLVVDAAYVLATCGQYLAFTDQYSSMPGLSDWIEQLIAESTGKNQIGRLPIVVQNKGDGSQGQALHIAFSGGSDLVIIADLSAQFFLWEWVTALLCAGLQVNPFNQPNVTEAKNQSAELLKEWKGKLPEFTPDKIENEIEIFGAHTLFSQILARIPEGGYLAIMAYLDRTDDVALVELRKILASKSKRPVTFGWGPRFLHSTGQFHKGGRQNGAFLQITGSVVKDIAIPDQIYGFQTLLMAQALGDGKALLSRGLPTIRLHLKNRKSGIAQLLKVAKEL